MTVSYAMTEAMCGSKYIPRFGKTWQDHFQDKGKKSTSPDENIWPGTLEGLLSQVVRYHELSWTRH